MAGNGGGGSANGGAASIIAAAAAAGSAESRFPSALERRNRWEGRGCWSGLACFGADKRTKRIVPSSRVPDGSASTNAGNASQPVGLSNQITTLTPSLLAPPSSPASFSNYALPSQAQSPSCFLSISANSPGEPSSTMFATGPYAHETQLVSPPVFSTFTTEPSTAPLTPPPELAHITMPSSPDVPFARYLSSSLDLKDVDKENCIPFASTGYVASSDLQATYPLCPGSPSSSLISPVSGTPRTGMSSPFPEQELPSRDALVSSEDLPYSRNGSSKLFGLDTSRSKNFMLSLDSSYFYPASSAQFYLDQAQQSYPSNPAGARLSISREADNHGNGHRQSKNCKQDVEEIEAYRASFGFSADEIIPTPNYVISDTDEISFTVSPFTSEIKPSIGQPLVTEMSDRGEKETAHSGLMDSRPSKSTSKQDANRQDGEVLDSSVGCAGSRRSFLSSGLSLSNGKHHALTDEILFSKIWDARSNRSFRSGLSSSDSERDCRNSRSLKDANMEL